MEKNKKLFFGKDNKKIIRLILEDEEIIRKIIFNENKEEKLWNYMIY